MPSPTVIKNILRELFSLSEAERAPEPDLVMDDPDKVAAFRHAGLEGGVMAPVYLYHCAQVSEVIRPGDTVLDLGCGPANQLAMIARLNADVHFIGMDLSEQMLGHAQETVRRQGLQNVSLQKGDITRLEKYADASVDAIYSTVVLHHLPDEDQLEAVFREVERVLKPGGGLYLVDFGHLKTEAAICGFAYQYADRQPELFTVDYLNSLRAAFLLRDWRRLHARHLAQRGSLYSTFLVPYMVAIKSPARRELPETLRQQLADLRGQLPQHHKTDFKDLIAFFRLGGLRISRI